MPRFSAAHLAAACLLEARILLGQGELHQNSRPYNACAVLLNSSASLLLFLKNYNSNQLM